MQFPAEFLQKYTIKDNIRTEPNSTLYRCTEINDDEILLVKLSLKKSNEHDSMSREKFEILKTLDHRFVIRTIDYYENRDVHCLVTEYCENGDLFDYWSERDHLPDHFIRSIMKQLLNAVDYLHSRNLVHQDIKMENICLDHKYNVKLIDFEFLIDDDDEMSKENISGTPVYYSPEKVSRIYKENVLDSCKPADVWACGIMLYGLVVNYLPFELNENTLSDIVNDKIEFYEKHWAESTDDTLDLVFKLLCYEYQDRITIQEALEHPFFD